MAKSKKEQQEDQEKQLLLERTDTISTPEKVKIQEALKMYDNLRNEHPRVQKILAEKF